MKLTIHLSVKYFTWYVCVGGWGKRGVVRPPRHQLCLGGPMLYKVGIDQVAGVVGAVGYSFKCTFLYLVSHGILKNSHGKVTKLHFRISLGILLKPSSLAKYQLGKFDIIIILMEYIFNRTSG